MWTKKDGATSVKDVVLRNTGLTEEEFLHPERNPHLFHLDEAVALIKEAISAKQKFYIMGDYDCDGITATSIMYLALKEVCPTLNVFPRLPKRFSEGYGLSEAVIDEFDAGGFLITVDNGIAAIDAVQKAKNKGLTVLVTDHHLQREDGLFPNADCILDPNTDLDTESSFRGYCGAGIAYRIAAELIPESPKLEYLRALAAVGTIADVMTLVMDNRNIVIDGLSIMSYPGNQKHLDTGLIAILNRLDLMSGPVFAEDIGFKVGPIINAAGRMRDDGAKLAFDALVSDDEFEANELAKQLIEINDARKELVKTSLLKAEDIITNECLFGDRPVIIAGDFHEGIVGIIAGRLVDELKTPVIVLSNTGTGTYKGSGRSFGNIHLKELLDTASDLLVAYGGHAGAVGLTVSEANIEPLRERLLQNIPSPDESEIGSQDVYDLEVDANGISDLYEELEKWAPYGEGNPKPILKIVDYRLAPKRGKFFSRLGDGSVIKLNGRDADAVGFGLADKYEFDGCPRLMDLYGTMSPNSYNGVVYKQIEIKDFEKKPEKREASSLMGILSAKMAGFNKEE